MLSSWLDQRGFRSRQTSKVEAKVRIQSNLILEPIYKRRGNVEGHDCKHLQKTLCIVVTIILPGAVCHQLLEGYWNTLKVFPYFLRHHQLNGTQEHSHLHLSKKGKQSAKRVDLRGREVCRRRAISLQELSVNDGSTQSEARVKVASTQGNNLDLL